MKIKRLGDPHLGRKFTKGVPLARQGERERRVREDFLQQLDPTGAELHICMGDLFDQPQVSYDDLMFAVRAYRTAAAEHPNTTFVIIQGNHDKDRDGLVTAAWDVFCAFMMGVTNIRCVTTPLVWPDHGIVVFPWHPTLSAEAMVDEQLTKCQELGIDIHTAYGHWDVDPRTQGHNLIPTRLLSAHGVDTAYTGHIHKPDRFTRDGVDVTVVGSMQPYAQGEDGGQSPVVGYVTMTLEELQRLDGVTDDLSDYCVRLILQPGEQAPEVLPDCLSFNVERAKSDLGPAPADASMEGFDTLSKAREALNTQQIIPEVRHRVDQKLVEMFGRET